MFCRRGVCFGSTVLPLESWQVDILKRMKSNNLKVGIRPEFIEISPILSDDTYEANVRDVEDLGTYKIVTLQLGEQELKVRQNEEFDASIGSSVHLSFPKQWLMLYVDEFLVQEQQ